MKRVLSAVMAILCFAPATHAQIDRATLYGTVKDASGGVLAGASVTVTNIATNVASKATTASNGAYLVVNLGSGQYLVEAEAPGLAKSVQSLILDVGQRGRLDLTLGVGGLTETVVVEGARRPLNTEDASLGSVIDQNSVAKLPLAIRNWDDLLALVPGVQGDRFTEQGGGTSFGRTGGVNVHGARSLQNNFLLDGVDNNSVSTNVQELTSQVSRPSVDSIQEFKVVTSPYSAEYGRSPGAAISVSTKSGTNEVHGTVYDFFRNEKMDTNDFFSKRAGQPKPANDQNQFGGNLGGPLIKDKAFFFVDYEGTRITRGVSRITRVPTEAERAGILPGVRDPLTGVAFPGGVIPASRIDPYAAAIMALVPLPNQPGANNFFRQADLLDNSDRILGRLDYKANSNNSVFARYIYSNRDRQIPGAFGGVIDGTGTSGFGNQKIKTNALVVGWTHILSPSMVNEFRFSWSKSDSDAVHQAFGLAPPPAATIPNSITNPVVAGGFPGIVVDGFFGGSGLGRLGSPDFLPKFQHTKQFEFIDSLSWLKGSHALKAGVDIIAPMSNDYYDIPAGRGQMRFRNSFTGNSMGDYLLGYVADFQLSNVFVAEQRHWASMFYVQDDWKVNSKLSLNLGLRYDFITPALEARDLQTNFDPAGGGSLVFAKGGSLADRGLVKPDKNNFAPRVGVVYTLNEKTVLRGGWGIFYNLFDRIGSEDQLALNLPQLTNSTVTRTSGSPVFFLQQGIPSSFLVTPNLDPAVGGLRTNRLRAVSNDAPKTTVSQGSIGFQRELRTGFVLTVDGVYTKGTNLGRLVNLNQPLPNAAGNNALGALPYPNFGFIEYRSQDGESEYKGVDVGLEKRFSNGYSVGVSYTLADSQDNTSEHLSTQGSNSFPQNSRDISAWYGPSDYDVRHRLAINYVVELPFGKGKKFAREGAAASIFGGWTLSGIFTARSGRPFTVNQSGNNVGTSGTGLPDQVGDSKGPETVDEWFNKAAFVAVTSGTFGNEKRNGLIGPNYKSVDFSLQRRIEVSSRIGAVLRWDVFNAFNRVNFGLPERNISSAATFGSISSLGGDPRLMQVSLRLTF
ncbi:MAG: TonB-dependent receptor [Vicinamibacteria bacterium]|nr:TonB-dependent receptor [Vicinamibacteria bacterium]